LSIFCIRGWWGRGRGRGRGRTEGIDITPLPEISCHVEFGDLSTFHILEIDYVKLQ